LLPLVERSLLPHAAAASRSMVTASTGVQAARHGWHRAA